jgi:hypothetical protein
VLWEVSVAFECLVMAPKKRQKDGTEMMHKRSGRTCGGRWGGRMSFVVRAEAACLLVEHTWPGDADELIDG